MYGGLWAIQYTFKNILDVYYSITLPLVPPVVKDNFTFLKVKFFITPPYPHCQSCFKDPILLSVSIKQGKQRISQTDGALTESMLTHLREYLHI